MKKYPPMVKPWEVVLCLITILFKIPVILVRLGANHLCGGENVQILLFAGNFTLYGKVTLVFVFIGESFYLGEVNLALTDSAPSLVKVPESGHSPACPYSRNLNAVVIAHCLDFGAFSIICFFRSFVTIAVSIILSRPNSAACLKLFSMLPLYAVITPKLIFFSMTIP